MAVTALWLTDFRCFESVEFRPDPGVTVIRGRNGAGKTSLLEGVGVLATMRSFRGAHREVMVRRGTDRAIVRGEVQDAQRRVLIEAELPLRRPGRIQANRQVVRRMADLGGALRISVFSPEDLELVQGPPAGRREFLDSGVVSLDVSTEPVVSEVERILRQRGALLRQAHGALGDAESTLAVWDERLAVAGTALAEARERLVEDLTEPVADAYGYLAGKKSELGLAYERSWQGHLGDALAAGRAEDLRQQTTSRGPHRDELVISLDGMPARSQASQGEQRCAALALRLAFHELVTSRFGTPPVLLLDDVFSELDAHRAGLLAGRLPTGQVLLASAVDPPGALSGNVVNIEELRS
jgi:DNA replication and repair protein RecF